MRASNEQDADEVSRLFVRRGLACELRRVAPMSTIGLAGGRSLLIEDAAIVLGVSRRTIYYRIREGRLETLRTRGGSQRVLLSSIERLLHEGRRVSAAPLSA